MHVEFGEYQPVVVRNASILTNGYVAGYIIGLTRTDVNNNPVQINTDDFNFCALECDFTIGSLTSAAIKVEFSDDNVNFYALPKSSTASGIDTVVPAYISLAATGLYYISVNNEFFNGGGFRTRYIRVSANGVGTVTSSSLKITAVVGVV